VDSPRRVENGESPGEPGMDRIMKEKIYNKRPDIVFREIAGENLLVPIRGDLANMQRIFSVNAVGGFVWDRLDGKQSVQEIAAVVYDHFDAARTQIDFDVESFIASLVDADLVVEAG
jgi:Coenzyme PQQ synthesis protein D (PqqD)